MRQGGMGLAGTGELAKHTIRFIKRYQHIKQIHNEHVTLTVECLDLT
jgi:hypothetical protein